MKIGVVCAMSKELLPLLKNLGECKQQTLHGFNTYVVEKGENQIIIVQSGIGEIYASGATMLLINLGVEKIINAGVCGALKNTFSSCDVVVASGVVHYDFDLSPIDNTLVGQYPNEEVVIKTDSSLISDILKIGGIKTGIIASADKFVADEDIKKSLVANFDADICDMESAGVFLTCKVANIPCILVKCVSDGGGVEEYFKTVHKASKVVADILTQILEN